MVLMTQANSSFMTSLLIIEKLTLAASPKRFGGEPALRDLSFSVAPGEVFGVLGEAGAGKSLLLRSIAGRLPRSCRILEGSLRMGSDGEQNLWRCGAGEWRRRRRRDLSLFADDPRTEWNSRLTIRQHLEETLALIPRSRSSESDSSWMKRLYEVGLIEPEGLLERRPPDLPSLVLRRLQLGFVRIRGVRIWLMDEPALFLDAAARLSWLSLIREMARKDSAAVVVTSGSMRTLARIADRIGILSEGSLIEEGSVQQILESPREPYTRAWVEDLPAVGAVRSRPTEEGGESTVN